MAKRTIKRTEEIINPETGEIHRTVNVTIIDKSAKDSDFIKVYKAVTRKVIKNVNQHESVNLKVLWFFMDRMQDLKVNQEAIIYASDEELAETLQCSIRSIKRAKEFLIGQKYFLQYIEPVTKRPAKNTYLLNSDYFFKGNIT